CRISRSARPAVPSDSPAPSLPLALVRAKEMRRLAVHHGLFRRRAVLLHARPRIRRVSAVLDGIPSSGQRKRVLRQGIPLFRRQLSHRSVSFAWRQTDAPSFSFPRVPADCSFCGRASARSLPARKPGRPKPCPPPPRAPISPAPGYPAWPLPPRPLLSPAHLGLIVRAHRQRRALFLRAP